jgi:transcriptional regulator with AAA-type ATPase domain
MMTNRVGPKPWYARLPPAELHYFLLRCRAALAEPFAELTLVPHPWDEQSLALVGNQIAKVVSLFEQMENYGKSVSRDPMQDFNLELSYREIPEYTRFWNSRADQSFKSRLSFGLSCLSLSVEDRISHLDLILSYNKERLSAYCLNFLSKELKRQSDYGSIPLALPRDDWKTVAAADWVTKCWDLRIRLTAFVHRFLALYQQGSVFVDPFTVFFLRPSLAASENSGHIRSGFFGYEYVIDKGQLKYLAEQNVEVQSSELLLPFPNGVCAQVFLSGRASSSHTIHEIQISYPDNGSLTLVRDFEQKILTDGTLIEIPVYASGVAEKGSDGPDLIVTVRIPANGDKDLDPSQILSQYGMDRESVRNDPSVQTTIEDGIKSGNLKTFLNGESQIVTECFQRLVNIYLRAPVPLPATKMVADSTVMQRLRKRYLPVAKSNLNILLGGSSGTGKSTVAEDIWRISPRSANDFKRLSAATLSKELALSQLFGHVEGAFTSASKDKRGLLDSLHGGTLFLDDIDALDLDVQARLLSYLDNRQFFPAGGEHLQPHVSDVRLICATNQSIQELKDSKLLRTDFLFRVGEEYVEIPGLNDRKEDIPGLIHYFVRENYRRVGLERPPTVAESFIHRAVFHSGWENGELRKLRSVVCRAMVYSEDANLTDTLFERVIDEAPAWELRLKRDRE